MALNLLSIPLELRDEILRYVVLSRRVTPNTKEEVESQEREVLSDVNIKSKAMGQILYSVDPTDYMPTALSLLLTNKQLNLEVLSTLNRISGKGTSYELDVKVVQERYLAPTWVLVPSLAEQVHAVCVVFQTCAKIEPAERLSVWWQYRNRQCLFVWALYSMLERFLHVGPVSRRMSKLKRNISIGTLVLDFVDPEEIEALADEREEGIWLAERRMRIPRLGLVRPAWLCKLVKNELRHILRLNLFHTPYEKPFGAILCERVGNIVFKVNGIMQEEFDLGRMLAEMTYSRSFGQPPVPARVARRTEKKLEIMDQRKKMNLSHAELAVEWVEEALQQAYQVEYGSTPRGANDPGYVYRQILPRPSDSSEDCEVVDKTIPLAPTRVEVPSSPFG